MTRIRTALYAAFIISLLSAGCSGHEPPADCDIERGPCLKTAGEALSISFDITPKPVKAMAVRFYRVILRKGAGFSGAPITDAAVTLGLSMPGMHMAQNMTRLYHAGNGVYEGECVIVRCPGGGKVWKADVAVERPGGERTESCFTFRVK